MFVILREDHSAVAFSHFPHWRPLTRAKAYLVTEKLVTTMADSSRAIKKSGLLFTNYKEPELLPPKVGILW